MYWLFQQFLRIVGTVEIVALRILAGARVVAADDQVRAAVVLADDRVPERFARPAHAHCEGQQRQHRGLFRIAAEQVLVAAHAREMIDVARLGHADDRVDQQVRLLIERGPQRQFLVSPVHRVTRLEGHDLAPSELAELLAQLGRTVAKVLEIVMGGSLDPTQLAADINRVGDVVEVVNGGVGLVGRAVHALRFRLLVRRPDIADFQRGDNDALEIA
jgi:hypothetical protein